MRYLSFLGIGKAIKHCAFIMHTAQDTYVAHVFYCEPSSGALCKTIEAACKVCTLITLFCLLNLGAIFSLKSSLSCDDCAGGCDKSLFLFWLEASLTKFQNSNFFLP